ncbi:MFS transporter [Paenibacillus pasadenensis]|uniref:MFS transporter n=1 Tax=Paenibacillus pasadenensis TaxID=217090 RepID=UPI00203C5183|nr:MFS transporter [Paenibacillus pasadenensis]MCM3748674.1 MFS transporter [Paenibacillus pasadenensis]
MQQATETPLAAQGKTRFPLSIYSLTAGAFAIGMTEFVIMGLLPEVAADLGVTVPKAGHLITGYALGVGVGAPVLALATARFPKKLLLVLLMVLFIIGNAAAALAPTYGFLLAARVFTSLAHGTFFGIGAVYASSLVSEQRKAGAVAAMMAGLTIANILGVPFGTFIGQELGWRMSFAAVALMGVITLVGLIILIPSVQQKEETSSARQIRAVLQPKIGMALLIGTMGCISMFSLFSYIKPLLTEVTGFSAGSVPWVLVLIGCGVTVGNILGGKLADRALMPTVIGSFVLQALLLLTLGLADESAVLTLIILFLWGATAFSPMPGLQVRIMTLAKDAPALASTSNHAVLNFGNAFGAFFGGWIVVFFQFSSGDYAYNVLPWTAAAFSALGVVFSFVMLFWDRSEKASANEEKAA